jgi:hypothetical protein
MTKFTNKIRPVYIGALALGVIYYILLKFTPVRIPCVFHLVTGYQCPGCGISRMIMSLTRLDFSAAFHYNQAIFCLLPVWTVLLIIYFFFRPKCLSQEGMLFKVVTWGSLVILLLFGILRNI